MAEGNPVDLSVDFYDLDPFDSDLDYLQPQGWLADQMGLKDLMGKVKERELTDLLKEKYADKAIDNDGMVDMGRVTTLRPVKTEDKGAQARDTQGNSSGKASNSSPVPRSGKNAIRLITDSGMKLKRCTKCGETKPINMFDPHKGAADGHQAYCKKCKSALNTARRDNSPAARLKHHIASRCMAQCPGAPSDLTARLEEYVGYRIVDLVAALDVDIRQREGISLQEALRRGYHIDHRHPLSAYKVQHVGDAEFRACWAISNLWAIPAADNLRKGAKIEYDRSE